MSDAAIALTAILAGALDGLDRDRLVLAYSGGPDSTALARALIALGIRPLLVHVDHALRADHEHEVAWVQARAARWGLALLSERVPPGAIGRASLEAGARAARYRVLARVAHERGACAVLTAHTLDDQAETVLLRLERGTGARGLAAIPPRRPIAPGSTVALVRPLLDASRALLRAAAQHWGEDGYLDPSNASRAFRRNRVRHDHLARWPVRVRDALVRVARASARIADRAHHAAHDALTGLEAIPPLERLGYSPAELGGDGAFAFDRAALRALGLPLWSYAFEARLGSVVPRLESAHLARLAQHLGERSGQVIEWPGGWRVHVFARWILVARRRVEPRLPLATRELPAGDDLAIDLAPLPLVLRLRRGVPPSLFPEAATVALPDVAQLVVRGPLPTDVLGRARGHKRVRALLGDAGWAVPLRPAWPVLLGAGRVLWVPGCGAVAPPETGTRLHAWLATPQGEAIAVR